MDNEFNIGSHIKKLRKSMGLTQEQLAEKIGIDNKHLSKIENGFHLPTYKTIRKISEALKTNLELIDISQYKENLPQNTSLQKSLKILNSAKTEQERNYYYEVLKLAQKGLAIKE